ncbi:ATP-grasp domain-containing protein [Paenibacillus polymyxa]|uniref:ATP-grasp domain-containing protein n=1 Tax=Paenibacillus polymyxa (strain SC2) TaxID=886882 RepID=E3EKW6_PAEPS|nr:ATP-grasp domain-containing protein [Paenibacillus polymyxa]ADO59871.1 hypothetical protein PPSC2_25815 [Paenibacillus polymyxa SC2]WPQ59901.1 ATP-grasp domain-containing protein [Paenibacillus polymyxa]
MNVLFCSNPMNSKQVDDNYEQEYDAARSVGITTALIDIESLLAGDTKSAIRNVRMKEESSLAIYRGWMLNPQHYRNLYEALQSKNIILINTPEQYIHCHYLPNSFKHIKSKSMETEWIEVSQMETLLRESLKKFGNRPLIVKDYVKSRKHDWLEACFIPNANDIEHAEKVIHRFIELQAEMLAEGIVLREFVDLEIIGFHPLSRMPLANERRLFFLNQQLIANFDYWDEVLYQNNDFPLDEFVALAQKVESNFFTMDVAKKKDGKWIVMELGDGQVSGLPIKTNKKSFYEQICS